MSRPQSPETHGERVAQLGAAYKSALLENMARLMGGRPSHAAQVDAEHELDLWLQPTSPAAQQAIQMGGTLQDAQRANAMWAQEMRNAGATPEDIAQTTRRFAVERATAHGQGDPEKIVAYHEKMAKKAAERLGMVAGPDGAQQQAAGDPAGMMGAPTNG
jgi:hypothetical protein